MGDIVAIVTVNLLFYIIIEKAVGTSTQIGIGKIRDNKLQLTVSAMTVTCFKRTLR